MFTLIFFQVFHPSCLSFWVRSHENLEAIFLYLAQSLTQTQGWQTDWIWWSKFKGPRDLTSAHNILVNVIPQEHQERISSNLAHTSTWTQGFPDYYLAFKVQMVRVTKHALVVLSLCLHRISFTSYAQEHILDLFFVLLNEHTHCQTLLQNLLIGFLNRKH